MTELICKRGAVALMAWTAAIAATLTVARPALCDDYDAVAESKKDTILRALVDELNRNKDQLNIKGLASLYFIEYGLADVVSAGVGASLGCVTERNEGRYRMLRADVRVGSYEMDNSNFEGGGGGMGGMSIPIEDDYDAIRQAIWWATDRDYKSGTESIERKKAFMESKLIADKPPDFSHAKPVVFFEDRLECKADLDAMEKIAVTVSKVFREYPDLKRSEVNVSGGGGNKYLVNTEGTRIRSAGAAFSVAITATVQAEDGMELSDSVNARALSFDALPNNDKLIERTREMVAQLLNLRKAPKLKKYTGPVLFEAKPATQIFWSNFGGRFSGGQRPVGGETSPDDFENKIDERILPKSFMVVDDPTLKTLQEEPVFGTYKYDDQGVPAQKVALVEKGRLRALLMARNPSKKFKESNGHGRGLFGPSATPACMVVSCNDAENEEELKKALLEACKDEGLKFGIRIKSLGGFGGHDDGGYSTAPLLMYKVRPDGKETLVRGAEIGQFDQKVFKRILAAGDKLYVGNQGGDGNGGTTVAAPAMLFEELDLAQVDRDFDKPPILPNPLARESSGDGKIGEKQD